MASMVISSCLWHRVGGGGVAAAARGNQGGRDGRCGDGGLCCCLCCLLLPTVCRVWTCNPCRPDVGAGEYVSNFLLSFLGERYRSLEFYSSSQLTPEREPEYPHLRPKSSVLVFLGFTLIFPVSSGDKLRTMISRRIQAPM